MILEPLKRLLPERHPLRLLWHRVKAGFAALRYGLPARNLTVIGVTGTDGKTTTVGMIAHILQHAGIRAGALSTAFFQIEKDITWNATQKTSPSPFIIQRFLRRLARRGCTHAVLEVSSHGLTQNRVSCTWPKIAAITNIAEEHLDYHGSMDEYIAAKARLFHMLQGKGTKILNGSDRSYPLLSTIRTQHTIVCQEQHPLAVHSAGTTHLWLEDIHMNPDGSAHAVVHQGNAGTLQHSLPLRLPISGLFNLENALTAIGVAMSVGVTLEQCTEALRTFHGIPGRMERIDEGQAFSVYVDFTVTPQAYEKTLRTLKESMQQGTRLLVLTGSCGDRMREKRPLIGAIVSTHADLMVVTNEDPYTEDPEKIIDEVWAGVDHTQTEAIRISDRGEAIRFLLTQAAPGDTVLLCGKGSDTTMMTAKGQIPWNERAIVREILNTLKKTAAPVKERP